MNHNITTTSIQYRTVYTVIKKFKKKQNKSNQFQTIPNEFKKISNSKVSTSFSILNSYTIFKEGVDGGIS